VPKTEALMLSYKMFPNHTMALFPLNKIVISISTKAQETSTTSGFLATVRNHFVNTIRALALLLMASYSTSTLRAASSSNPFALTTYT